MTPDAPTPDAPPREAAPLRTSATVTGRRLPDAVHLDEFAYGVGPPDGILLLRYTLTGRLDFGRVRDDLIHQLYWCPSGLLSATGPESGGYLADDEAFWAPRGVAHEVRALADGPVYRVCLRQVPAALTGSRGGGVVVGAAAAAAIALLTGPGAPEGVDWRGPRARIMAGLSPAVAAPPLAGLGATPAAGPAELVARALVHDPADPTPLPVWAQRVHCSSKTLQRDFERTFGMSFTRWRTAQRLEMAQVLVRTLPVADVARVVGYAGPSAFVAAYARRFGHTPGRGTPRRLSAAPAAPAPQAEGASTAPP